MIWIDPSVLSPALCLDKHLQIKIERFYDSNVNGIKTSFFQNHNEHRALIVV